MSRVFSEKRRGVVGPPPLTIIGIEGSGFRFPALANGPAWPAAAPPPSSSFRWRLLAHVIGAGTFVKAAEGLAPAVEMSPIAGNGLPQVFRLFPFAGQVFFALMGPIGPASLALGTGPGRNLSQALRNRSQRGSEMARGTGPMVFHSDAAPWPARKLRRRREIRQGLPRLYTSFSAPVILAPVAKIGLRGPPLLGKVIPRGPEPIPEHFLVFRPAHPAAFQATISSLNRLKVASHLLGIARLSRWRKVPPSPAARFPGPQPASCGSRRAAGKRDPGPPGTVSKALRRPALLRRSQSFPFFLEFFQLFRRSCPIMGFRPAVRLGRSIPLCAPSAAVKP